MYLVLVYHCRTTAPTGGAATMSSKPVCRPVSTSVIGRLTGESCSARIAARLVRSPSGTQIFLPLRSPSPATGCPVMK